MHVQTLTESLVHTSSQGRQWNSIWRRERSEENIDFFFFFFFGFDEKTRGKCVCDPPEWGAGSSTACGRDISFVVYLSEKWPTVTQSDRLSVGRVSERANMRKRALPHASICCIRLNWLELIHTKWAGCAESTAPYVNHGRTCVSQVNGEAHRTKMAVSGVRVRADQLQIPALTVWNKRRIPQMSNQATMMQWICSNRSERLQLMEGFYTAGWDASVRQQCLLRKEEEKKKKRPPIQKNDFHPVWIHSTPYRTTQKRKVWTLKERNRKK